MTTQKTIKLRVCASCEWIFREGVECPKCQFASYGARFVYGVKCYQYEKTQAPWRDKKIAKEQYKLHLEIWNSPYWLKRRKTNKGFIRFNG